MIYIKCQECEEYADYVHWDRKKPVPLCAGCAATRALREAVLNHIYTKVAGLSDVELERTKSNCAN